MKPLPARKGLEVEPTASAPPQKHPFRLKVFAGLFGAFLGLAVLKFGNPPIMEKWVSPPTNIYEFLLDTPWPIAWAYGMLAALIVLGIVSASRVKGAPLWILVVPLLWWVWQALATAYSINPALSQPTLFHFTAVLACFYLGFFTLSRLSNLGGFWTGLMVALLLMMAVGWQQHFGGLEETRRYFLLYLYPKMHGVPPEYLKKMQSTRIFGTLFYPNALAGALLLLLPISLAMVWGLHRAFTVAARRFLVAVIGLSSLACLYWSGSKGGWLLMLLLGLLALLRLPMRRALRMGVLVCFLVAGLVGFAWKYAAFFEKGATSVSARFDYWRAAVEIAETHPVFGTGPGTFGITYAEIKRPESEMARLTHNDYLEQACDSGVAGFLAYISFIVGALVLAKPCAASGSAPGDWTRFALWLGTLGWALQGLFEFGLYLPALAWPAFTFLGLLLGMRFRRATENAPGLRQK